MDSLRECVTCKDIKDTTYLLPCLHPTCSQCIEDIVQDAKQKKRKLPSCRDCGESFVQDKLTTVPSSNNNSTSECAECGANATHFCRDCNEYLCKPHGEPHSTTRRFKGHVVQLVVELPFCNKHSTETAVGFCTHCKVLLCTKCTLTEHNKPPHMNVTLQEAAKTTSDSVKKDVAKLLESVPAIDKEIKKHTDVRTKLEKERAELEAKIVDIRKQEKVTTLQIDDLEKTKALLLTTQTQTNALASTATTIPHASLFRLQSVITTRVLNLQAGLGLMSGLMSDLISVAPTLPATTKTTTTASANTTTATTVTITRPATVTIDSNYSTQKAKEGEKNKTKPSLQSSSSYNQFTTPKTSAQPAFGAPQYAAWQMPTVSMLDPSKPTTGQQSTIQQSATQQSTTLQSTGQQSNWLEWLQNQSIAVSNNRKTITNTTGGWRNEISDDGWSFGAHSWRITINFINATKYDVMLGIWNSSNAPTSNTSCNEANAWVVNCYTGNRASVCKAGSCTRLGSTSPLQSGDVILLTVDAGQRRLAVQNTTRGWTHNIDQLPPPNPAYHPHVVLRYQEESVTIEAAS